MANEAELRREIEHLRVLAEMTVDERVLRELGKLIAVLEERLRDSGNGATAAFDGGWRRGPVHPVV